MDKDPPPPYTVSAPYPGIHQAYPNYQYPNYQTGLPNYTQVAPPINIQSAPPTYGATHTQTTIIVPEREVIIVGACPACRIGVLEDDFTGLGLLCAILFFPLGVLCCLMLKEKKCTNCGATFA